MVHIDVSTVRVLQLCRRLSDSKCWAIKQDPSTGDSRFYDVQPRGRYHAAWYWPEKQLTLDKIVYKYHINNCTHVLPDLEEDMPIEVRSVKKEADEDYLSFEEAKQCAVSLPQFPVHKRLVSRRYVFMKDFPASHAALKPFYGSELVQDNSSAVYISIFSKWKNEVVDLIFSTQHLVLPSLLRLLSGSDCGISDQALKKSMHRLMTFKNTRHLYALYSAMKALAAFHPRSSRAVNCHLVEELPKGRSRNVESLRDHLVLDYIISCCELELLHYPMVRRRSLEVSKLLAVDGALLRRLIQDTEDRCSDVKTLALLQRTVSAVGMSDKWLSIDRLVSRLYQLYRRIRCVRDRQRLLASIAKPQLRLKLVECILTARCCGYVRQPSKQFLSTDSVTALSLLLSEWLHAGNSSAAIGNTADQIEEYLAIVVTFLESNLHIHKGLLSLIDSVCR